VGEGAAVLTGPHPESVSLDVNAKVILIEDRFAAVNLNKKADGPGFAKVVDDLAEDDKSRTDFVKTCLIKLGLKANQEQNAVPSLSRLHLSSLQPADTSELVALKEIISIQDGESTSRTNDTFHLEKPSTWSLSSIVSALPGVSNGKTDGVDDWEDSIRDYNTIVKRVLFTRKSIQLARRRLTLIHHAFFANLKHYQSMLKESDAEFVSIYCTPRWSQARTMLEK
jgi:biotin--protein ligase